MDPERTRNRGSEAWLDIPDPWASAATRPATTQQVPRFSSPTRARVRARRIGALALSLVWAGAVLWLLGFRWELADNAGFVVGQTLVWIALSSASIVLAMARGRLGLGSSVRRARALAVGAPFLFLIIGLLWLPGRGQAALGATGSASALAVCFGLGMAIIAPTVTLGVWSVRRSFASAAGWRGALLGAAAGLGAATVLTLHCASALGGHIALAHGLPVVVSTLAGAIFGSRLARA